MNEIWISYLKKAQPFGTIDMKETVYIIALSMCVVSTSAQEGFRKEIPYGELTLDTPVTFEHYNDLKVYAFQNSDSTNLRLACSCNMDTVNHTLTCYYESYRNLVDGKSIEQYNNGRLVTRTFYYDQENCDKSFYTYNSNNQIHKIELFRYSTRTESKLVSYSDSVYGIKNGEIFVNDYKGSSFNYSANWKQMYLFTYLYDSLGRQINFSKVDALNHKYLTDAQHDTISRVVNEQTYRNFTTSEDQKQNRADRESANIDYTYYDGWHTSRARTWDGIYLDTIHTDSNGQIIQYVSYRKLFEGETAPADNPFTEFERFKYEYDFAGRRKKEMMFFRRFSDFPFSMVTYQYYYINKTVPDIEATRF